MKDVYDFLVTKTRTKAENCKSCNNENCEDFLIFDWILRNAEENVPFLVPRFATILLLHLEFIKHTIY